MAKLLQGAGGALTSLRFHQEGDLERAAPEKGLEE